MRASALLRIPLNLGVMIAMMVVAVAGVSAPAAAAATAGPGWTIDSFAMPSSFSPGDNSRCLGSVTIGGASSYPCDSYALTAVEVGEQQTDGSAVTLADTLPPGLTVRRVSLFWSGAGRAPLFLTSTTDLNNTGTYCTVTPLQCTLPFQLEPNDTLKMVVYVTIDDPSASGSLTNAATVTGGGALDASTGATNQIGGVAPVFGLSGFSSYIVGADGAPDVQAGDHPYEFISRFDFTNGFGASPQTGNLKDLTVHEPKDIAVDLPLGFLGSAVATPTCRLARLAAESCPRSTEVGHIASEPLGLTSAGGPEGGPIYNMVPEHGVAAEFGFIASKVPFVLYANVVPAPEGYVLRVTSPGIPQVDLTDILVTFFGDPAVKDESCDTPVAALTNPGSCSAQPLTTTAHLDSWQSPGGVNPGGTPDLSDPNWVSSASSTPPVTGCNLLQFRPTLSAHLDTTQADSPAGLDLKLTLPQTEDPSTLATPPLKSASVTLPAGVTVDPSAANGLTACSEAQIGWLGGSTSNFTPDAPTCPDASKLGTVELNSPLLAGTLQGSVYLAAQDENPFHSLLAGYIVIDDPTTGVIVKIPGELKANATTGQITGVFENNPQLPFSALKLHFFGGPRGDLATPEACGAYTTTSNLEPWSAPDSGPNATPSDSFQINTGCVSGFAPAFTAGTRNPQAGAFSPFTLSFSRQDSEEAPAGLTVSLPTGLLGKIAGVDECSDAQIAAAAGSSGAAESASPSCPASSQIGTVQTGAGPGPSPFFASGKAYLTGPYKGAPYGVAVIVPAVAGPFDLGTVVIRQALFIDPNDSHVTDVSDPFPTILKGIPLRIKRVDVTLDRQGFTFNPTSCEPKTVNATVTSIGGAHTPVSSRFQAANCASLPFKPSFAASTQGRTSKANGASLTVKLSQKPGEANLHRVNLQLPIALPSRLTTLQKACTEAQFNANPAGCPPQSFIGTAKAATPVLATPLTGPAILVSHGGAAFPDVEFLLQSEGVQITLDGKTDIKKGITYSRFETVPDAPISSFETVLPEGPHSVLAPNLPANAKASMCGQSLKMPTTITGQNGATLTQTTPVEVQGCRNALSIPSHSIKGRTLTLSVSVPSAGKLTASGKGLSKTSKSSKGRETLKLTLRTRKAGKLKTTVRLSFAPKTGKKLSKSLSVKFKH